MMRVSIIGTGYVGLVTAVCLADKGHEVVCVDIDEDKVDKINRAIPPIYEKGLEELLKKHVGINLRATTDIHRSVMDTDISLIAVGTPFNGNDIDLTYIKEVSQQIGRALREKAAYHVVVVKSTVVPGTTDELVLPILERASEKKAGVAFGLGMNPEFLREGEAIQDFMCPDRIVLGGIDESSIDVLERLYCAFEGVDRVRTNNKTAEMIKYASNALLATMISFSNEIGNLCASLGGIDVKDVMKGVHLDKRLSPIIADGARIVPAFTTYLEAGCGFGGSCFPKDVKALIAHGKKSGTPMRLLDSVIAINEQQPKQVLSLIKKHYPSLKGVRIGVLGLAFKPDTDDMRESPAIPVIEELLLQEAEVKCYDPIASSEAKKFFLNDKLVYSHSLDHAVNNADVIVILTRWKEFAAIPDKVETMDPQPLIIDGRRMLDKKTIKKYEGIGL